MHRTGDFIPLPNEFSAINWDQSTRKFLNIIKRDLTNGDWDGIFKALHRSSEFQTKATRIKAGAPVEEPEHEALLPVDPPSSPMHT
jgi:hypothetical protein